MAFDKVSELPEEILLYIFTYLQVLDVLRVGRTCRRFFRLTNENVVWRWRFLANNDHLLKLPHSQNSNYFHTGEELWKRLYYRASHALSFGARYAGGRASAADERLCAEFVRNPGSGAIRFDDEAPPSMSVEVWVKLDRRKPDGVIIGCQSESVR